MRNAITLTRAEAQALADFCAQHDLPEYFIAKDHGAYLGAVKGREPDIARCLFYFPGMNPETDPDWYDTTRATFGGDDFGDLLPVEELRMMLAQSDVGKIRWRVTEDAIEINAI